MQRLKHRMIKKPSLRAFVHRHLTSRAFYFLNEIAVSRMKDAGRCRLDQIQAAFQVYDSANYRSGLNEFRAIPCRMSCPIHRQVRIILPKINACAQPIVTLFARRQFCFSGHDLNCDLQIATVIADDA